ncbi:hypothetical protein MFLAVUS_009598 [Mucor flavus]|uniref:Uncharacterized protein n=1 Tax=Mucor flavus TaxID=439312 RepID=A0ABP9ZAH1_9FUNG
MVITETYSFGMALGQCYVYYGIRKLCRLVVSRISSDVKPKQAEHVIAPAAGFVPTSVKFFATAASSIDTTANSANTAGIPVDTAAIDTKPVVSAATATKSADTSFQLDLTPKVYPDSHLSMSIKVLSTWIKENGFNELSCIDPTNLRNYFDVDFRKIAASILIELFTMDRCSRLKGLLLRLNETEVESTDLAMAVSRIMMRSLGFPEDTDTHMDSYFQFVVPMLSKTLQSCRDSFVCDFMLYSLVNFASVDSVLENDNVNDMVYQMEPEMYHDVDLFLQNAFMKPMEKPKGVFKLALSNVRRWIGATPYAQETELLLTEFYTKAVVRELEKINAVFKNEMERKISPLPNSPGFTDLLDDTPLRRGKRYTENRFKRRTGYSDFSVDDLEKMNEALQKAAEKRNNAAETSDAAVDSIQVKPLDSSDQKKKDPQATTHRSSASGDIILDYNEFLNYQLDVPENEVSGTDFGVFQGNTLDMKLMNARMKERLKKVFTSKQIFWFNELHTLSESGLTSMATKAIMHALRELFLEVIANMKRYEAYIKHYEKEFVVRQLVRLIKMYKWEIKRVCQMNNRNMKGRSRRPVCSLRNLTVASTCSVWNLMYVYERFAVRVPELYGNEEYRKQIKAVYNEVFKLGKRNMGIEERALTHGLQY